MNKAIDNKTKIQKSILNKYLNRIENEYFKDIHEKYSVYQKIFNSNYKDQIINLKESEYEQIFQLRLFQTVLGYQIDIGKESPRNIKFQPKSKEGFADGGIYLPNADDIDKKNIAVIEMKDSKTKEINKINNQAFKYFKTDPNIKYTIICNFLRIRIYLDNTKDYIDFPIFNLSKDDFQLLYLFISYDSVLAGWPSLMKNETVHEEKKIEKRFYVDYSKFRDELFKNIVKNNTNVSELILFNRTQKLLDRFIFIFFAEDKGLIYPNFIESVISYWKDEKKRFGEKSLYEDFNRYFNLLDKGREKAHNTEAIFAFNGGLFMKDQVLENLKIDCDVLATNVQKLSSYDFTSQITVDILGHIFEHSLNDIEETQAKLNGKEYGEVINKRKKDGVYYTPTYITEYIVVNTLGKLCDEKKLELDINEKTYVPSNKRSKKRIDNLNNYRNWLLGLTICDPACGSGAFLNQALSFLIDEHQYIDELSASYHKDTLLISKKDELLYYKTSILENNIYGVDINEESVEIAKLSLWLRTAQKDRKLTSLSNNLKCGNSLIDDPEVAGDKTFNWEKEFPEVFANGGFDIVIGNPPYVLCQPSNTIESILNYYKTFEVASYKIDLFHLFFEKSISLLKRDGILGFITPNTYLNNKYIKTLRSYILAHSSINSLINYKDEIFIDAGVDVATIILTKRKIIGNTIELYEVENSIQKHLGTKAQTLWEDDKENLFNLNKEFDIKLNNCVLLGGVSSVTFGLQTKDKKIFVSVKKNSDNWESCYTGKDVSRYYLENASLYFLNEPEKVKAGGSWNMDIHHSKKIVVRQVGNPEPIFAYDKYGYATLNTMYSIVLTEKEYSYSYILSILNSKLIKSYFLSKYSDGKQLFPKIKGYQLKELPVKVANKKEQTPFIEKADQMLSLNKNLQELSSKFQRILQRKFELLEKLPKKLEKWYELTFTDFIKELKKKKIKLSLVEEVEWEDYFLVQQLKAIKIKAQITKTDNEIDAMVYELYGINDDEIAIIENESK